MCDELTDHQEARFGSVWRLCEEFSYHLAMQLRLLGRGDPDYASSAGEYARVLGGPALKVLGAFRYVAKAAIIENDYFDIDYRSEFGATHQMSFSAKNTVVQRVHFFRASAEGGQVKLRDFVEGAKASYLGYVVIRPQVPCSIGRSLVTPSGRLPELRKPENLQHHIRTAVREHVELFGVRLAPVGVPFMEQDGHLLRCAHVSAWMCHYTAVLRGLVSRRTSAQFHLADDSSGAYGRQYPSDGVAVHVISQVLRRLDLPPDVIDDLSLLQGRPTEWFDRPDFVDAISGTPNSGDVWFADNFISTVCRYLNSGIPCILWNEDEGHTRVLCGYVKHEDLQDSGGPDGILGRNAVAAFIACDDLLGPFELVSVCDLVGGALNSKSGGIFSLVVPLPKGLWLGGEMAESYGASMFRKVISQRLDQLPQWVASGHATRAEKQHERALRRIVEKMTNGQDPGLAVRTYATTGSDFKVSFGARVRNKVAARITGYVRLPKYVWVVEVVDRELKASGKPRSVVGTVVLDATAFASGTDRRAPIPLLCHIPGQISELAANTYQNERWHEAGLTPYESGRWNHEQASYLLAESFASKVKTAWSPT